MIKLKNGFEVAYNKDFDLFFKDLLKAIIAQSHGDAVTAFPSRKKVETLNDIFLREIMDNCIYVTHQLFELHKENEEFSKFIVTGFLFNGIILSLPNPFEDEDGGKKKEGLESIH